MCCTPGNPAVFVYKLCVFLCYASPPRRFTPQESNFKGFIYGATAWVWLQHDQTSELNYLALRTIVENKH